MGNATITTGYQGLIVTTAVTGGSASTCRESVASPGSIEGTYERVLPWNVARWNPDLQRFEQWHNWYGFWRECSREFAHEAYFVSYGETWVEPIDSNDEPESYRQLPSTRGIARKTGGRRG